MKDNKNRKVNTAKKAAATQSPKRVSRKTLRRKRMIKRIIGVVFGTLVIGASLYASSKLLFVVKTVNISGSQIFTSKEISDFMAIPVEESMFKVDVDKLETDLLNEFKYLEDVKITKRFPDIIEVTITDSVESY